MAFLGAIGVIAPIDQYQSVVILGGFHITAEVFTPMGDGSMEQGVVDAGLFQFPAMSGC